MWGRFCWAPAAFLQGALGLGGGGQSGLSRPAEVDPPSIVWKEPLPRATDNWTLDAAEPGPPACRGDEDCPLWSSCEDHVGRRVCRCGLGYHLHPSLGCVPAKVFPALLKLRNLETPESSPSVVTRQVRRLFQHILARLDGYLDSPVYALNWSGGEVTILHHFSAWGPVTEHEVDTAVDTFRAQCRNGSLLGAATFCDHVGAYQAFDLCRLDVCEPFSTSCSSRDGLVSCSCHSGFFRAHALDRTCTACESGFWLENGVCTRCPFGFGGVACQEPLLLALVAVSCFGGLLLGSLLALALRRRAPPSRETPGALPLPLRSRVLSLPRVQPPWALPEPEDHPRLTFDPQREGPPAAGEPRMKTFLGSRGPPPSDPPTAGGCRNLVFVGEADQPAKQDRL